jgi:hypothetical protein
VSLQGSQRVSAAGSLLVTYPTHLMHCTRMCCQLLQMPCWRNAALRAELLLGCEIQQLVGPEACPSARCSPARAAAGSKTDASSDRSFDLTAAFSRDRDATYCCCCC